jgi:hypothetical protein
VEAAAILKEEMDRPVSRMYHMIVSIPFILKIGLRKLLPNLKSKRTPALVLPFLPDTDTNVTSKAAKHTRQAIIKNMTAFKPP